MTYIMFARWFSFISLALSLGILLNLDDAREMAKNMASDESGYIMGGVLPIIFGSFALTNQMDVVLGWQIVVIVVGIMMVAIGLYRVLFVSHWKKVIHRNIDRIPSLFALFGLIFGLLLFYVGFLASMVNHAY